MPDQGSNSVNSVMDSRGQFILFNIMKFEENVLTNLSNSPSRLAIPTPSVLLRLKCYKPSRSVCETRNGGNSHDLRCFARGLHLDRHAWQCAHVEAGGLKGLPT